MTEAALARMKRLAETAGLPGVEESTSFGNPALKVGGKGFVGVKGELGAASLRIPMKQKEFLLAAAPEIYFETDHYKGWPWVLVRMDAISDEELTQRLVEAWRFRAPKTLVKAIDGNLK